MKTMRMLLNLKKFILLLLFIFLSEAVGAKVYIFVFDDDISGNIAYASKIIDMPLTSNLTDKKGNLTGGELSRISGATYVDSSGVLQNSRGNRENLIDSPNDITTWWSEPGRELYAGAVIADSGITASWTSSTYILQLLVPNYARLSLGTNLANGEVFRELTSGNGVISSSTGVLSLISAEDDNIMTMLCGIRQRPCHQGCILLAARMGMSLLLEIHIDRSTYIKDIMLEALPSGNVIGDDLFDQETLMSLLRWQLYFKYNGWTYYNLYRRWWTFLLELWRWTRQSLELIVYNDVSYRN